MISPCKIFVLPLPPLLTHCSHLQTMNRNRDQRTFSFLQPLLTRKSRLEARNHP